MMRPESQRLAREILVAERALKVQVARERFAETLTERYIDRLKATNKDPVVAERLRQIERDNGGNTHG